MLDPAATLTVFDVDHQTIVSRCTYADFLDSNENILDVYPGLAELRPGESLHIGGGASPLMRVYRDGLTNAMIKSVVAEALNAAVLVIQQRLGVTDGKPASHWFSDGEAEGLLADYLCRELGWLDEATRAKNYETPIVVDSPSTSNANRIDLPYQDPKNAYEQFAETWSRCGGNFAPDAIAKHSALDSGIRIPVSALRSLSTFLAWVEPRTELADGFAIEIDGMLSPPVRQTGPQVFLDPVIGRCPACHNPIIDVRPYPEVEGIGTVRVDGAFCCSEWEGDFHDELSALRQCEITRARIIGDTQPGESRESAQVYPTEPVVKRLAETVRAFLHDKQNGRSPEEQRATLEAAWNVCVTEHPWW